MYLLTSNDDIYQYVFPMIDEMAEACRADAVHIGMDEAHMVGLGKYLDIHGYTDRYDILRRHMERVNKIARSHGFEPMMWSDMFFRSPCFH